MKKLLRRLGGVAAALGLAFGLTVAGTGTAQAATASWWTVGKSYVLFSQWGLNCLDDSTQYGLRMYPCSASSQNGGWQAWRVLNMYGNYAQLQNVNTGQCLDWSPGAGLRVFPCYYSSLSGGWQGWMLVNRTRPDGTPQAVLQNGRYQDGEPWQCLDNSQYGVRGYPCNGTSQDNWYQGWEVSNLN